MKLEKDNLNKRMSIKQIRRDFFKPVKIKDLNRTHKASESISVISTETNNDTNLSIDKHITIDKPTILTNMKEPISEEVNHNKSIFIKIHDPFISDNLTIPLIFLFTNYNPSKLESLTENGLPVSFVEIDTSLKENKNFKCFYKTYKDAPPCISETFLNSSSEHVKSSKIANVTWKLYNNKKMKSFISNLATHQKYSHFVTTFQLGRKDNLWKNFCKFKTKFPDDFKYMPMTYILPEDRKKFTFNKSNLDYRWIAKPVSSSRGRGISILEKNDIKRFINQSELKTKSDYLISKYVDKPHLINGKKYDLRLYVLITSYSPLKIYLYRQGIVRFASEKYDPSHKENIFVHLTNYAVNKMNEKINIGDGDENSNKLKWTLSTYEKYFIENKKEEEYKKMFDKIRDIIIKSVLTTAEDSILNCKLITNHNNCLFEMYGYDILIDEGLNPWLLEVNVSPSLNCDSELDFKLKSNLIGDIINTVGIIPSGLLSENITKNYKPSNDSLKKQLIAMLKGKFLKDFYNSDFKLSLKDIDKDLWEMYSKEVIAEYQVELIRSKLGSFNQIFPKDRFVLRNYLKYLKQPGDENIMIWFWLMSK